MTEKQHSTSKAVARIEARHGAEAAIARSDVIASHRMVNDAIKEQWAEYQDQEGNTSSSPNSFMTLRKHWNRLFGIKSVKDLDGDPERSLLYALANVRAAKAIRSGVDRLMLRSEIRQATYAEFERAKTL